MSKTIFFTADWHLGHESILKHQAATRPFSSTQEMDEAIIGNCNEAVGASDKLFILGDFCWKASKVGHYRARINCKEIVLIRGNHDKKGLAGLKSHFSDVFDLLETDIYDTKVILCHYALRTWNKSHYGSFHLYGHSHGSLPGLGRSMDVGIDCHGLKPISWEYIKHQMDKVRPEIVDHHTGDCDDQG